MGHARMEQLFGPDGESPSTIGIPLRRCTAEPFNAAHEGIDPRYFYEFSRESYAVGINVALYAMTH